MHCSLYNPGKLILSPRIQLLLKFFKEKVKSSIVFSFDIQKPIKRKAHGYAFIKF